MQKKFRHIHQRALAFCDYLRLFDKKKVTNGGKSCGFVEKTVDLWVFMLVLNYLRKCGNITKITGTRELKREGRDDRGFGSTEQAPCGVD